MKVLLLITKGEVGGAQNFVANLARGLKKEKGQDLDLVIACGQGDFLANFAQQEGIKFFRFKSLQRSGGFFSNLRFLFDFFKYLKQYNFDIIHLNSSNALIGAMIAKIVNRKTKIVFTVHGLSILDPNYQSSYFKKILFKSFFKWNFLFIDKIVFVSQKNLDLLTQNSRFISRKSFLIYNGIQADFLDREEARSFLLDKIGESDDNLFLFGSIGRLAYPKNYEFLLNNFSEVLKIKNNARLILIGDGPKREEYERIILKQGLEKHVFLLGEIVDASKYLKALDLFILPSIYEGLSISLIEAYLANIKSIASLVGGNEEIIGQKYCFELNNLEDFLRVLEMTLNSKIDYQDQEKFSLDTMVKKYLNIYEER
jgi:glycosyltransferase involved in cell wall biosynthesis